MVRWETDVRQRNYWYKTLPGAAAIGVGVGTAAATFVLLIKVFIEIFS